jgi:hypothetical protein
MACQPRQLVQLAAAAQRDVAHELLILHGVVQDGAMLGSLTRIFVDAKTGGSRWYGCVPFGDVVQGDPGNIVLDRHRRFDDVIGNAMLEIGKGQ